MEQVEERETSVLPALARTKMLLNRLRVRKSMADVRRPYRSVSVLVVDDDLVFCMIMQALGRKLGLDVTAVVGPDKLAQFLDRHFDVAIVDVNLNLKSGVTMVERLSGFFRNTPVVLVSESCYSVPVKDNTVIREFVSKTIGPHTILDAALENWELYGHRVAA